MEIKTVWDRQKEAKDCKGNDVLLLKRQSDNSEETRNGDTVTALSRLPIFLSFTYFSVQKKEGIIQGILGLYSKSR